MKKTKKIAAVTGETSLRSIIMSHFAKNPNRFVATRDLTPLLRQHGYKSNATSAMPHVTKNASNIVKTKQDGVYGYIYNK